MSLFKKLLTATFVVALSFSGVAAGASTPQDATVSFNSLSVNDCVRDPMAMFAIPSDVQPYKYKFQVTYDGTSWVDSGEGLVLGKSINLMLFSKTKAGKLQTGVRIALQYGQANSTVTSGPWSAPWLVPADLIWSDSQFCEEKRAREAEQAKLELLPGPPQLLAIRHFDNSSVIAEIDRPTKVGLINRYTYEGSFDGSNWFTVDVSASTPRYGRSSFIATFKNPSPERNLAFVRIRAVNASGNGPWLESGTGRFPGNSAVIAPRDFSSNGLTLYANPISTPGAFNSSTLPAKGCTFSSLELGELNPSEIADGDKFRIETSLEELAFAPNQAPQIGGQIGYRDVPVVSTNAEISQLAFRVQLCPSDIAEITPRYLRVKITRERDGQSIQGLIKVIPKTDGLGGTIENTKFQCGAQLYSASSQASFTSNLLIEQTSVQKTTSAYGVIQGTLMRHGLVAANQAIDVFKSDGTSNRLFKTLITDSEGQFILRFNFDKGSPGSTRTLNIFAQESASGAGLFNDVFSVVETPISFKWLSSGLTYQTGASDWIPSQTSGCASGLQLLSTSDSDERHPVAWFVAKKVYYGMKNKSSRNNQQTSSSKTYPYLKGGQTLIGRPSSSSTLSLPSIKRCYVSGYTTRTGKRVSSYYRSC